MALSPFKGEKKKKKQNPSKGKNKKQGQNLWAGENLKPITTVRMEEKKNHMLVRPGAF